MSTSLDRSRQATSIGQFLEEAAVCYSGKNTFSCGPMRLRYSKFAVQGHAHAAYFQSLWVSNGDQVALMTPNLSSFPISTLGILKTGAVQVNINPLYTASELEYQLNDSGAETLITGYAPGGVDPTRENFGGTGFTEGEQWLIGLQMEPGFRGKMDRFLQRLAIA